MYSDLRLLDKVSDINSFVIELKSPWKTMANDMGDALRIIYSHASPESQLSVCTLTTDGNDLSVVFPDWQDEVESMFINQYGLKAGRLIFHKVLMRLFLMSRGQVQQLH